MIGAGKATIAMPALEGLGAGVLPVVARQLVASGEAPFTTLPRTLVRFFSCLEEREGDKKGGK